MSWVGNSFGLFEEAGFCRLCRDMAFGLCRYRDALGKPGVGVHAHRIAGVAAVDLALTVVVAALAAWWFDWSFGYTFIGLFLAGVAAHRAFCVRTTVDQWLFESKK